MTAAVHGSPTGTPAAPIIRRLTADGASGLEVVQWAPRSVEITNPDGSLAFVCDDVQAPVSWSNLAVSVVARRYLAGSLDGAPERSVHALIERVIGAIATWAADGGQACDPTQRAALFDELAALVLTQRATFATPVWLNCGLQDRPLTSACFILSAQDSITDLLDWNMREALIFHHGGGAGINLSGVRSAQEPVSRGGMASGPVSFMRAADAWAATIRAGGRARRGAQMVVLDADHPDIFEFIEAKALEEDRGRTLLTAGYPLEEVVSSLAFQHANHSVRVTDQFMQLATRGGNWTLRAVTSGETLASLPAPRVLYACAEAALRCGDPGLLFSDQIARWHTCPNTGPVTASNPCGEFLHVPDSACNLATLNLLAFLDNGSFDVRGFTAAVEDLVTALDAIVDGSGYPSEAVARNAHGLRTVGIGYANLAALLLSLGIPYDSDEGRDWAAAITALMTGVAYRRSAELAAALGPFREFEANREPMLAVLARHAQSLRRLSGRQPADVLRAARAQWRETLSLGRAHGLRNAQTTLIAPTGTVSLMLDCETTGIEPYYSLSTVKRFADGGEAHLTSRAIADSLAALGHSTSSIELLSEYALDHGRLADAPLLRDEERRVFQTATGPGALTPIAHLKMVAAVQPFLSGGVSKTVPLPDDAGVETIQDVFIAAWRLGLKSIAVYREGSKLGQPLVADAD